MWRFKNWWNWIKDHYQKSPKMFWIGIPLSLYLLGVLTTVFDKGAGGFSLNPFVGITAFLSFFLKAAIIVILLGVLLLSPGARFSNTKLDPDRNFRFSSSGTFGTAELMDNRRMRKCFNCVPVNHCEQAEGDIIGVKDGLVISQPLNSPHNRHFLAIGGAGSMKSRAIARNKIIGAVRRGESIVVSDPKGELFRDSAVWLRKSGYRVAALNLVSLKHSSRWNFLLGALQNADDDEASSIVEQISFVIIQNTSESTSDFWSRGERAFLKALLLRQYIMWKNGKDELSFPAVYDYISNMSMEDIKKDFTEIQVKYPGNPASKAYRAFMKSRPENTGDMLTGLAFRLDLFLNGEIRRITGGDDPGIDLELTGKEKCAYFAIVPDQHSTYDFLVCLFFTLLFIQVIKYADTESKNGRCEVPVNVILDEFPNIGEIPDFLKKLATTRSRAVNVAILCQSLPDLIERYPYPTYERIMANCDHFVYLGGNDPITVGRVSWRSGDTTAVTENQGENHNKLDPLYLTLEERLSKGDAHRQLLTDNEVLTMAKDNQKTEIIMLKDQPVLFAEKFDYTRDPESKKWEPISMKDYDPDDNFWKMPDTKGAQDTQDTQSKDLEQLATDCSLETAPAGSHASESPEDPQPAPEEIHAFDEAPGIAQGDEMEILQGDDSLEDLFEAEWRSMQDDFELPSWSAAAPDTRAVEAPAPTAAKLPSKDSSPQAMRKLKPAKFFDDDDEASSFTGGCKL